MKVDPIKLKEYLEAIGEEDKENEIRFSEYMEPEYQESDLNRGIEIVENYMEMLSQHEKFEKMEEQ